MGGLLQEYVGSHVEIMSYEDEPLAMGIIRKSEGETLEIGPSGKQKLPTLLYRLPVKICLFGSLREELTQGGVVYLSHEDFLIIDDVKRLREIEKRDYFRVTVGTSGVMSHIASPLHQEMRRLDKADERAVWVISANLTGVQFISDIWLELDKPYLLRFVLNENELTLCVKVQQIVAVAGKPIEYDGVFFDVLDKEEAALCRCLYQVQMIERKRRANSNRRRVNAIK